MSVNLNEIQQEAVRLCEEADTEIKYRNAISRVYYSLYHYAYDFAENNYTPPPSAIPGPSHAKLRELLSQDLGKDMDRRRMIRKLGISLRTLHERRCDADYQLNSGFCAEDVEDHKLRCLARIDDIQQLILAPAA